MMAASSNLMIAGAERRFPRRIKLALPASGLDSRGTRLARVPCREGEHLL
jgi:hypothetical protein